MRPLSFGHCGKITNSSMRSVLYEDALPFAGGFPRRFSRPETRSRFFLTERTSGHPAKKDGAASLSAFPKGDANGS